MGWFLPQKCSVKISYVFLILLLIIAFIPISHEVHCAPFIFPDQCATEQMSLGFYVGSHIVSFVFQMVTLGWGSFTGETIWVFFGTIFLLSMINFLFNILFKRILNISLFSKYGFLKKSFSFDIPLRLKRILVSIFVFLVIFLLCFLIIEGTLRLIQKNDLPNDLGKAKIEHDDAGWVNKPNFEGMISGENGYPISIKHNNMGFRAQDDLGPKQKKRVLLLGDSFVYGAGLDVHETLDFALQEQLGDDYEVINGGVSAFSTLQEYRLLQNLTDRISPDIVLVGVYSNDFKENIFIETSGNKKPIYAFEKLLHFGEIEKNLINYILKKREKHPITLKIGNQVYKVHQWLMKHSVFVKTLDRHEVKFLRIKEESYKHTHFLFTRREDPITLFAYVTQCGMVKLFAEYAQEHNMEHFFFYIPSRFEIEQGLVEPTFAQYYDINEEDIDLDRPQRGLQGCARKNNLNFISLKGPFLAAKEQGMFNKQGHHWSPAATNLTASLLKKEFSKLT